MPDQEHWQAYEQNGELGRSITKDEARSGVLHGASHVWIWRKRNDSVEVLLQQRAKDKLTWPGFLDVSAAGHIDFGEVPIEAAVRETSEEIALRIDKNDLQLLFVRHVDDKLDSGVRENEFVWVYLYELPVSSGDLRLDPEEVDSTYWLSLDDTTKLSRNELPGYKVVPHIYFPDLLAALRLVNK